MRQPEAQPGSQENLPYWVPRLSQIPVLPDRLLRFRAGPSLSTVPGHSLLWTNMAVPRRKLCLLRRLCARVPALPAAVGNTIHHFKISETAREGAL